jgi:phosphoserine phosphatase
MDQLKSQIPAELLARIEEAEANYKLRSIEQRQKKIAAFDLDNTLLIGDIGEAVYIQFKIDEQTAPITIDRTLLPFSWPEYEALLAENKKKEAYTKLVEAMAGIPVATVKETTERVMDCGKKFLSAEGATVPVPIPNPVMQAVVKLLRAMGCDMYIISASHQIAVEYVAETYFGIPGNNVAAMRSKLINPDPATGPVLAAEVVPPMTVGNGKAENYRKYVGPVNPLITAGDSTTDLPVLNLTSEDGLIIWVGEDDSKLEWVKQNTPHPKNVFFLRRPPRNSI